MADDAVRQYLSGLGKRGGLARAKKLTDKQRKASAVKAARARWRTNDKLGEVLHTVKSAELRNLQRERAQKAKARQKKRDALGPNL